MTILFQDDFSDTQLVNGKLTGWPEGLIQRPDTIGFEIINGNRMLKISADGDMSSGRSTEIIQYRNENETWGQLKIFFPAEFLFTAYNKWFSFCNPMFEYVDGSNTFMFEFMVCENELRLWVKREKTVAGETTRDDYPTNFYFTREVWHTVKYHLIRHATNGIFKVWVNNELVFEWGPGETKVHQDNFNWTPMKHYCDPDETTNIVYWGDVILATSEADLEGQFGPLIEPPPPEPFTMEVKPCIVTAAGAPLALLAGLRAFRTYLPGWFVRGYYSFSKFVLAGW